MTFITDNWQRYFDDRDEGLGTTYERFILHRYFGKIKTVCTIESVLEVPSFGMTGISGINSMWWSLHGAEVTVVDDNTQRIGQIEKIWKETGLKAGIAWQNNGYRVLPFSDNSFDLSWTFAALNSVADLQEFFSELSRITRKIIFICIPNDTNLCRLIRSELHVSKVFTEKGVNLKKLPKTLAEFGWQVIDEGYFDIPPWPDIAMKKEDLLKKLGLCWLANILEGDKKEENSSILDYFSGKDPNMEKRVLRWSFLEDTPQIFKKLWAHHRYFTFVPK